MGQPIKTFDEAGYVNNSSDGWGYSSIGTNIYEDVKMPTIKLNLLQINNENSNSSFEITKGNTSQWRVYKALDRML